MRQVAVAGIGMVRFGKYDGEKGRPLKTFIDLGREAVMAAWKDSGIPWKEIEGAFCGTCYSGIGAGHQIFAQIGLTGIPIVNVENACSSSPSAFRLAYQSVAMGLYDVCLVIGVDKVPGGLIPSQGWPVWQRRMGFNVQPAAYAMEFVRYMVEYGATERQFALAAVKNRRNGVLNPNAMFQKETTVEEVMASRMIAKPLRFLMCCPNADGATAAILVSNNKLRNRSRKVTVAASVLVSSLHGVERGGGSVKILNPDRCEIASKKAYEIAGVGPEDLDMVEAYDAMAPGELLSVERLGLCKRGEAGHLLEEGYFDLHGQMPVNPSGGLMSRGHPLGATGLAQIHEAVTQLRGEAGARQIPGAKLGMCNTLGAGPNCCITILKK